MRALVTTLCVLLPTLSDGECSIDPSRMKFSLTPQAQEIRDALFLRLCASAEGVLVDDTDPTLIGRLEHSHLVRPSHPGHLNLKEVQGTVVLAFLVDMDGSIREVTVLQSSGWKSLDEAALNYLKRSKYKSAVKLDGRPIRALMYHRMEFSVKRGT